MERFFGIVVFGPYQIANSIISALNQNGCQHATCDKNRRNDPGAGTKIIVEG
jgi:hypothetical protein